MSDCGAPAFDNIDELLTDKIARHSREHSDDSVPLSTTAAPLEKPHAPVIDTTPHSPARIPWKLLIAAAVILICLLTLIPGAPARKAAR